MSITKTGVPPQDSEAEGKKKLTLALAIGGIVVALGVLGAEWGFSHRVTPSPYDSKAGIEQQIKQTEASSMSPQAKQMTIMSLHKIEAGMDAQANQKGGNGQ